MQVTSSIILAGPRNALVHIWLEADGTGELTNQVVLDPRLDLVPPGSGGQSLVLTEFWSELSGFDVKLSFESVAPGQNLPVWNFTPTGRGHQCFKGFGGVPDTSGFDATGRVLISTNGFTQVGNVGTLTLMFTRKGS
jgi:hypothetical protein